MKKINCTLYFVVTFCFAYSQEKHSVIDTDKQSFLKRYEFQSIPYGTGTVIVDNKDSFGFPFEGLQLAPFAEGEKGDCIRACIYPEGRYTDIMYGAESQLKKDTLEILIYGFNGVVSQDYLIRVFDGKYTVAYTFDTTVDDNSLGQNIKPIKSKLKLSTLNFRKGMKVRGYTEFEGKCIADCVEKSREYKFKGNFSVIVE